MSSTDEGMKLRGKPAINTGLYFKVLGDHFLDRIYRIPLKNNVKFGKWLF